MISCAPIEGQNLNACRVLCSATLGCMLNENNVCICAEDKVASKVPKCRD